MPNNTATHLPDSTAVRHYDVGYNFLLAADSLVLQEDRPMHLLIVPEAGDTSVVYRGDPLVVAQIEVIPEDSVDSVWVKVARDQQTQGWVHESVLLRSVVPDDPISQGIRLFSDSHVGVILALCLAALVGGVMRLRNTKSELRNYPLVHLRDIASPYPMLLCLAFAAATVLYTTIQVFAPELWAHYYYHPTLNPFGQPPMLAWFLGLAWVFVVLTLAALDDIRHCLSAPRALRYVLSLMAVLGCLYLLFSLATQHLLGYPLLMAYAAVAPLRYWRCHRARYRCGRCGAWLHDKEGKCPKCGVGNE